MKKLLALVLALVMSMSLVTISNAAFKDADKIDYKEAVDVMNAVGVFIGDEKGNFNAKDNLTREQAAKIIAYLELGEKAADALVGSATFTDVAATRWSAGFVSYCAQAGVVSGYDGKFDPAGQLTALQFGKMLLVEIGYDAKAAGMVGTDWAINTSKLLATTGLMKGIDGSVNQVLTREKAAQMCLNALKTPTVEYTTKGSNITVNGAEINFGASTPTYVRNTVAKDQTISQEQLTNSTDYTVELGEKLYKKLVLKPTEDAFGRPTHTWTFENKKVGEYIEDADLTYTTSVKLGTIYSDLGLSEKIAAKDVVFYRNGNTEANSGKDSKNVALTEAAIAKKAENKIGANGVLTQVWYNNDKGTAIVTLIDTYVGKINSVVKATSSADRYVNVNVLSDTISNVSAKFGTEDFAADDLVTFTAAWTGSVYEIQSAKALEKSATGQLTQYTGDAYFPGTTKWDGDSNFTVDGTKYKYDLNAVVDSSNNSITDFTVGKSDMNVYLDDYGYAMYVEGVESETNYAVVIGVGNVNAYGNATGGATLLLPDGTKKEVRYKMADGSDALTSVTVNQVSSITNNTTDEPTGDLVTYTVDSDDTYKLTVVKSRAINGNAGTSAATGSYSESFTNVTGQTSNKANFVFENGKSAIISNAQAAAASQYYNYATSETIFFVANLKSGGKVDNYSVYTGFANMPSTDAVKGIKGISYVTNSKYTTQIDAIYMVVESLGGISDVQTYLVKEKGASVMTEKINGVQVSYYELPAIIDGEVTTARIDADLFDGARIANATNANSEGVYALKNINKDAKTGIITSADKETVLTGTGTQADRRDVLGIGATKAAATYYAYTKDTAVYFVNSDFDTITTGSISAIGTDDDDLVTYTLNTNNKTLKEVIVVTVDPAVRNTHNVKFVGFQNTFYVNDVNGQNMVSATVDTVKVNDGSDLKFMPVGVPGVMVKAVKVGNTVLTPDAEGYYTLSAVSKGITVTLEKATAVTLTFKAPTEGAYISVNGGANQLVTDTATCAVSVASGSTVTLTIVPASGQTVSAVTSTGNFVSGSANSYSIVAAATGEVVIAY
uniref:S-layer homology domain-containing protein n=1 Tax=Faecalibacterium prausnitzii TaxID=853 RepID=UPI003FEDB73D